MQAEAARPFYAEAYAECARIVQDGDPDRAVSVGFAPEEQRNGLWALYAFALETARIPDHVSQPLPGEIRLQWWRDRLSSDEAEPEAAGQGSPTAVALVDTVRRYDLPRQAFDNYLDARIFDLYADPMGERADFEAYAGETVSSIIMLAAMILDRAEAAKAADAAGHLGVAACVASVLRSADRHRVRQQIFIPADILRATGTSAAQWLSGGEGAENARSAMLAFGRDHLAIGEKRLSDLPLAIRPAFLPAIASARTLIDENRGPLGALRRVWSYWRLMRH